MAAQYVPMRPYDPISSNLSELSFFLLWLSCRVLKCVVVDRQSSRVDDEGRVSDANVSFLANFPCHSSDQTLVVFRACLVRFYLAPTS